VTYKVGNAVVANIDATRRAWHDAAMQIKATPGGRISASPASPHDSNLSQSNATCSPITAMQRRTKRIGMTSPGHHLRSFREVKGGHGSCSKIIFSFGYWSVIGNADVKRIVKIRIACRAAACRGICRSNAVGPAGLGRDPHQNCSVTTQDEFTTIKFRCDPPEGTPASGRMSYSGSKAVSLQERLVSCKGLNNTGTSALRDPLGSFVSL